MTRPRVKSVDVRSPRLTYTATWGSYYNASDANATVAEWQRVTEANPFVGMRALAFVQRRTRRGVIAFRGTDLNFSQPSGQADRCANEVLFGGSSKSCQAFSKHECLSGKKRLIKRSDFLLYCISYLYISTCMSYTCVSYLYRFYVSVEHFQLRCPFLRLDYLSRALDFAEATAEPRREADGKPCFLTVNMYKRL